MSIKPFRALPQSVAPTIFLCFFSLLFSPSAFAQKTDVVHLKNGDRLTVEVKELNRGQMRLKTDAFGTIYVNWVDVDHIETDKRLQVELANGRRYYGPAMPGSASGQLFLDVRGELVELATDEIVFIQPIKSSKGLSGNLENSLSIGFNYTQASDVMQWHVEASSKYRTDKHLLQASYDSMVTNNGTGEDAKRRDLKGGYQRFLQNRWLWFANAGLSENDELGVDGRLLLGAGGGRYIKQSNSQELLLGVGLTANIENALGDPDVADSGSGQDTSLEGLLYGQWNYFKLHTPKSNVDLTVSLYPGITESDRVRGDARLRYRQEFVKDLFLNLTYYYNFDTDPPLGAVSESDYGVVTSLEYLF